MKGVPGSKKVGTYISR